MFSTAVEGGLPGCPTNPEFKSDNLIMCSPALFFFSPSNEGKQDWRVGWRRGGKGQEGRGGKESMREAFSRVFITFMNYILYLCVPEFY